VKALGPTIILTGTPGVGKSSVVDELIKLAEREGIGLRVINFGTTMKRLLESAGEDIHRDNIRREGLSLQRRIQLEAAREISKMRNKEVLVVDTHMFIRTPAGALPGLPESVLKELDPSLLVLVEAAPEDIATRRGGDHDRRRDKQNLDDVKSDLELGRRIAAACSVVAGVPVQIIRNEEGQKHEAAKKILDLVKEVS